MPSWAWSAGQEVGIVDHRGLGSERLVKVEDALPFLEGHFNDPGGGLSLVEALGNHGRYRLAVVEGFAVRKDGSVLVGDPEPRNRLRQVRGGEHVDHARQFESTCDVDAGDARTPNRQRDQGDLRDVGEVKVGEELLLTRDPVVSPVAQDRRAYRPGRL